MNFAQRASLIKRITSKDAHSHFYRNHYGLEEHAPALQLHTEEEWRALPFLSKEDLIASPLEERAFIPLEEVDHLRPSSGTSGRGVLFSPRTEVRGMEYRLQFHDFSSPFMAFTVPMMPHWHEDFQKAHGRRIPVVVFDPAHPDASVRLARIAGVDAFSVFVYHVPLVGEAMKREHMCDTIRFIEITGETCPQGMYEYLRSTFPNAVIVQSYNSSEVEDAHIGMPCRAMDGSEPLAVYHSKSTHYLEILDPETGDILEPKGGVEGDLLITAYPGEPSSFPLVRFRIGDTVRVVEEQCKHGTWSFTVLGRTDMDFLKIPGGVIRADEVERVLRSMPESVTDKFELHYTDVASPTGPRLSFILYLEVRNGSAKELEEAIATRLRVSPSMSYADGVREGRYTPLVCEAFEAPLGRKRRRIVRR